MAGAINLTGNKHTLFPSKRPPVLCATPPPPPPPRPSNSRPRTPPASYIIRRASAPPDQRRRRPAIMSNVFARISAATLRGGGEEERGGGRGRRACYGIAASFAAVLLFCVLAVVGSVWKASVLAGMVLLAFGVADYLAPASWCRRRGGTNTRAAEREAQPGASSSSTFGLEKAAVDALPTFAYASGGAGAAQGGGDLEAGNGEPCSVCLEELHAGEIVREMPACKHLFHVECIDMWLHSHRTCPMCRCDLSPPREVAAKEATAAETAAPPGDDALPPV
ncbi:RING-H2 finger protein ATL64 [Oryza sativa Japonica Group]|uniref:RING-H2 finger protein ATL64 n=1 Tax=Oryza sativa subsp. japonica TaxID=39947 RepID=UPI0007753E33|nr:RING-H2 finger protein ATL74 [Oryza sativa Japonica Group]